MKQIASFADLMVLTLVVALFLLRPATTFYSKAPRIPDKVEILYYERPSADSIRRALSLVEAELDEISYYLRSHNVTDEGYNLVAQYNTTLQQEHHQLRHHLLQSSSDRHQSRSQRVTVGCRTILAKNRAMIAVKTMGGYWRAGHFHIGPLNGKGIVCDLQGRMLCAFWDNDTIVHATRTDHQGIYKGQMDAYYLACGEGVMDGWDGSHRKGFWQDDRLHGFAFESSPHHQLRIGEWKEGKFLGEKLRYTTERIYGIDISRHQHEKGRQRFSINWQQLRITSLGKRHDTEGRTYPVSFVYIKSTEGTTIRNRYFVNDYAKAKKQGLHVGAYHFFSLSSTAEAQANYFVNNTLIRHDDFPPVLDVEPSDKQIQQIGGSDELMRRIRIFMETVERRTGKRPILYVNQMFVNHHMTNATDIKKRYNVWIARYGQYKPDVKLVYWQLCPDGRVNGITGPVDINVFNGYQGQFDEFVRTGFHQ